MVEGVLGIDDPPGHRWSRGTVLSDEASGMAARLGVQDIVDVTLTPNGDVLRLVPGDWNVAHAREELAQFLRFRMGELNEFEAVGASGIGGGDVRRRRVMRKGAHFLLQGNLLL